MKAAFDDDGTLRIRGETVQESLALTAWHILWGRRAAGLRVEVYDGRAPQHASEEDVWPPSHPMSLALV